MAKARGGAGRASRRGELIYASTLEDALHRAGDGGGDPGWTLVIDPRDRYIDVRAMGATIHPEISGDILARYYKDLGITKRAAGDMNALEAMYTLEQAGFSRARMYRAGGNNYASVTSPNRARALAAATRLAKRGFFPPEARVVVGWGTGSTGFTTEELL